MLDVVRDVADEVFIPLTVGGGIRTVDDIRETLRAGADKVSINTGAIERPELISEGAKAFGNQCILLSVDARRRYDEEGTHYVEDEEGERVWFEATIHGGREGTGIDVLEWVREAEERGAGEMFINSIDRDGTKDGYDLPLMTAVSEAVSTPVIASSGCGSPLHMDEVFDAGADAALAASIFHFEEFTIQETKKYLDEQGIPVRL
jgi:cyclase